MAATLARRLQPFPEIVGPRSHGTRRARALTLVKLEHRPEKCTRFSDKPTRKNQEIERRDDSMRTSGALAASFRFERSEHGSVKGLVSTLDRRCSSKVMSIWPFDLERRIIGLARMKSDAHGPKNHSESRTFFFAQGGQPATRAQIPRNRRPLLRPPENERTAVRRRPFLYSRTPQSRSVVASCCIYPYCKAPRSAKPFSGNGNETSPVSPFCNIWNFLNQEATPPPHNNFPED
jgi:hypothetical protein